jgi:aldehyde dehydrogenase (NAD+)
MRKNNVTIKKTAVKSGTWQYAPAPESTDHIEIKQQYELFINGKFVKPNSKKYFDTINPATEKKISSVAQANAKDIDLAVKAARNAYDNVWSKMPGAERAKYIYRIARLMQERAREFAVIESMDGGKPIRESRDIDIPLACNHFFIMQAGPTNLRMLSLIANLHHWGWLHKLFPGISHC